MLRKRQQQRDILGITNSWPPMVSGHGRFFFQLLHLYDNKLVIAPYNIKDDESQNLMNVLKYANKSGGILRLNALLQHFEILIKPLIIVFRLKYKPRVSIASQVLFSGLSCYLLSIFFKIPYVIIGHGEEFSLYYHDKVKIKYRMSKLVLKKAKLIICNTTSTKDIINRYYQIPNEKLQIIHPIVDIREGYIDIKAAKAYKENVLGKNTVILMTGRLWEERKGFDIGIKAFAKVRETFNDIKLLIVGPGDPTQLKEIARKNNVADNVSFAGKVDRDVLLKYFATCDIFLMPNRTLSNGDLEGFGIVFLEANLFGKPVIGGRSGGVTDAIEHMRSGLLVDGNNEEEVASALYQLLDNAELRHQLGLNGRERVLNEFNNSIQARKFEEVMQHVVAKS